MAEILSTKAFRDAKVFGCGMTIVIQPDAPKERESEKSSGVLGQRIENSNDVCNVEKNTIRISPQLDCRFSQRILLIHNSVMYRDHPRSVISIDGMSQSAAGGNHPH
jgi:hypothetical protein